jgi:hypothetical protein
MLLILMMRKHSVVAEYLFMIVLAKSYKEKGYCIAGKRLFRNPDGSFFSTGEWVRPVTNAQTMSGALYSQHIVCNQGEEVRTGDIICLKVWKSQGTTGQPENRLIADEAWEIVARGNERDLLGLQDTPPTIWLDADRSSDRVSPGYVQAGKVKQSLYFIKPENLKFTLRTESGTGRKTISASFYYNGVQYSGLRVTCPAICKIFCKQFPEPGCEEVRTLFKGDDYLLSLSLAPYYYNSGAHHKLVAGVFDFDGYLQRNYAA